MFLNFFNVLNCLQGVLIFILFVCKPNVKNLALRRFKFDSKSEIFNIDQNSTIFRCTELRNSKRSNFSRYNTSATTSASLASSLQASRKSVTATRVLHEKPESNWKDYGNFVSKKTKNATLQSFDLWNVLFSHIHSIHISNLLLITCWNCISWLTN